MPLFTHTRYQPDNDSNNDNDQKYAYVNTAFENTCNKIAATHGS